MTLAKYGNFIMVLVVVIELTCFLVVNVNRIHNYNKFAELAEDELRYCLKRETERMNSINGDLITTRYDNTHM
jgi:hypothetical protein